MKIQPSEITLKNGEKYLVRSALKSDAVELLKLLYQWSSETEYLLRTPSSVPSLCKMKKNSLKCMKCIPFAP